MTITSKMKTLLLAAALVLGLTGCGKPQWYLDEELAFYNYTGKAPKSDLHPILREPPSVHCKKEKVHARYKNVAECEQQVFLLQKLAADGRLPQPPKRPKKEIPVACETTTNDDGTKSTKCEADE